jgi:hypothetical protein
MVTREVSTDKTTESGSDAYPIPQLATFARTGEYWTISFAGIRFSLKDIKGLHYIERLLKHPGEEFHVLDLAIEYDANTNPASFVLRDSTFTISRLGDAGEILDARAKQDYKRRLAELREEFEELRKLGAHERLAKIESEIDFLEQEIARAVGLGGRNRRAGSAAERARLNVTRLIRTGLQKISEHNRALGETLDRSIRTGSFCSYFPDPRTPISWQFSTEGIAGSDDVRRPEPPVIRPEKGFLQTFVKGTTFVGREMELAALRRCLDRVISGAGGVVLIAGAAGVGKTRIAAAFGEEASQRGALMLAGGCYDREEPVPFVPFVEILEMTLGPSFKPRCPP